MTAVNEGARYGVPQEDVTRRGFRTLVGRKWDTRGSLEMDAEGRLGMFYALLDWHRVVDVAFVDVVSIERVLTHTQTRA